MELTDIQKQLIAGEISYAQAEILESVEALKEKMRTGVVKFKYTKVNGAIREATGTLNFDTIPRSDWPTKDPILPHTVRYYDMDARAWRSFHPQIVEVIDYQEIIEL